MTLENRQLEQIFLQKLELYLLSVEVKFTSEGHNNNVHTHIYRTCRKRNVYIVGTFLRNKL